MSVDRLLESKPILVKVFSNYQIKIWCGLVFALFFDVGKAPALMAIFVLIMFDFITGIAAAKYTGIEIKSAKVFRSAVKVLVYFSAISAGFMLEKTVGYNVGADDILIIFFGATEFISLLENMAKLGFDTPRKLLNVAEEIKNNSAKKQ